MRGLSHRSYPEQSCELSPTDRTLLGLELERGRAVSTGREVSTREDEGIFGIC